ncbi:hypothetical protein Anas_11302 [Armadillidium nasatum]|uniref:Uncharacterized protein n=1 Tax=Armadillidium nasatum TaxID=96803 RepID=A0A5N5T8Z0_9CRUS|nr:hypothetical protein Anas_11302 [Armadillidium nasatum]
MEVYENYYRFMSLAGFCGVKIRCQLRENRERERKQKYEQFSIYLISVRCGCVLRDILLFLNVKINERIIIFVYVQRILRQYYSLSERLTSSEVTSLVFISSVIELTVELWFFCLMIKLCMFI